MKADIIELLRLLLVVLLKKQKLVIGQFFCYTDALAEVLANTGVKEGDIINFSKHPTAFTETTDCNEFFTVSRLTDMEAYLLDSDTAHTVVALHKIKKIF